MICKTLQNTPELQSFAVDFYEKYSVLFPNHEYLTAGAWYAFNILSLTSYSIINVMATTLTIPIKFLADGVIEAVYGLDQTAISLVLCGTALPVCTGAGVQPHCSKLVGG